MLHGTMKRVWTIGLLVSGMTVLLANVTMGQVASENRLTGQAPVYSVNAFGQRKVFITKNSCPTSGAAITKALRQNPGWRVHDIKLISNGKIWSLTLRK